MLSSSLLNYNNYQEVQDNHVDNYQQTHDNHQHIYKIYYHNNQQFHENHYHMYIQKEPTGISDALADTTDKSCKFDIIIKCLHFRSFSQKSKYPWMAALWKIAKLTLKK